MGVQPTATIQELMLQLIDPSADAIWDAVGIVVTAEGEEEKRPATEEEWLRLRGHALRLVEASKLLSAPGRAVAAPGVRSENPGIELHPEDTQSLIDADPEAWSAMARALQHESVKMLQAIDRRDADGLFDNGETLDMACEACHRRYWYPDNAASYGKAGQPP